MKAVILAGGFGTRLSEETALRPKPMVEIGGKPILWHIMKLYSHHGINEFVICLGYKGYVIKEYFANYVLHSSDLTVDLARNQISIHDAHRDPWTVTLVDTGPDTLTGGRLRRIAHLLPAGEPFCFTYGDGVGDIDIAASIAFHKRHGRLATMTVTHPPGRFGSVTTIGEQVTAFEEKRDGDGQWVNGGFFVLSPGVLPYIAGDQTMWEAEPLRDLSRDGQLQAFPHQGFWRPMDTLRDKNDLESLWQSGSAPWKCWA